LNSKFIKLSVLIQFHMGEISVNIAQRTYLFIAYLVFQNVLTDNFL